MIFDILIILAIMSIYRSIRRARVRREEKMGRIGPLAGVPKRDRSSHPI